MLLTCVDTLVANHKMREVALQYQAVLTKYFTSFTTVLGSTQKYNVSILKGINDKMFSSNANYQ